MRNYRKHSDPPYTIVLVHGGPGAPGEMKPVAQELSPSFGVLEPLQTANSIEGQILELKDVIEKGANSPVILVGWSWGAWLAYLTAAKYPEIVKKLILVSSGPFEASYAGQIMPTRMGRLSLEERAEVENIFLQLKRGDVDSTTILRLGELMDTTDNYKLIANKLKNDLPFQPDIYQKVWSEAEGLRQSDELLKQGHRITCPVVAIHGDYDPHPWEGVKEPLPKVIDDFRFELLHHCGHRPWFEQEAKEAFYELLKKQLAS